MTPQARVVCAFNTIPSEITLLNTFDDVGALFSREPIDRDLVGGRLRFCVDRWWIARKPYVDGSAT